MSHVGSPPVPLPGFPSGSGPRGGPGSANRRRCPRFSLRERGQLASGRRRFAGVVTDVSEEGLSLEGAVPLARNSVVKVFVPLPDDLGQRRLHCLEGVVVWRQTRHLGVELMNLCRESRAALRGLARGA